MVVVAQEGYHDNDDKDASTSAEVALEKPFVMPWGGTGLHQTQMVFGGKTIGKPWENQRKMVV